MQTKIEKIIKDNTRKDAINKLNGYLKQYHWNQHLRTRLGRLYYLEKNFILAGKLLYFEPNPTKEDKKCIEKFRLSCGNKSLVEFRKIKGNNSKIPRGIDSTTHIKIFDLILSIEQQEGHLPVDVAGWICFYERYKTKESL